MDEQSQLLESARQAFAERDWLTSHKQFTAARDAGQLSVANLMTLADAAWWLGLVDEALATVEVAYQLFVIQDEPRPAAVCALTIAYTLSLRGESAMGSAL